MFDGLSAGGADIKIPNVEKQKAATTLPAIKEKLTISPPKKITVITKIIVVIKNPNKAEAMISPKIIAQNGSGAETNLSKVFILVSQGAITGVIADTAKNRAIPNKLGIKKVSGIFLPKKKEINKKEGINSP